MYKRACKKEWSDLQSINEGHCKRVNIQSRLNQKKKEEGGGKVREEEGGNGEEEGCAARFQTRICDQVQKKLQCVHNDGKKVYGQLRMNGGLIRHAIHRHRKLLWPTQSPTKGGQYHQCLLWMCPLFPLSTRIPPFLFFLSFNFLFLHLKCVRSIHSSCIESFGCPAA